MSDFFDKAKKVGSMAFDKAEDAAKIGKYKTQIASQKSEIKSLERQIGEKVYESYKEDEDNFVITDEIKEICQDIDSNYDSIALLEEKIDAVKTED